MTLKRLAIHFLGVTMFLAIFAQVAECALISGIVKNMGVPINGDINPITVVAYTGNPCESPQEAGRSTISSTGRYSMVVPPRSGDTSSYTYYLQVINGNASAFLDEWWTSTGGSTECAGAEGVVVSSPTSAKTVDFQLDKGATISGKVYQSDGTTSITSASNIVNIRIGAYSGLPCSTETRIRYADIDIRNSTYSIKGLPAGPYSLLATDKEQAGYVDEWWASPASTPDCGGAQTVEVTSNGQQITGKDFQLDSGGSISGTVYKEDGTTPVTGVRIFVFLYDAACPTSLWPAKKYTTTNQTNGTYTFKGLSSGTYYLWTHNGYESDYLGEWWASPASTLQCSGAQAVQITGEGHVVTGKNFQLNLGGSISGTVYQSDGTTPVTGKSIMIAALVGSPCGDWYYFPFKWPYDGFASTNPDDGTYSIRGLPLITYYVKSENMGQSDYLNEWWASPASTLQCSGAQAAELSGPGQAVIADFQLEQGGRISGTVYQSDGTTPLTGGSIQIWAIAGSSCEGHVVTKAYTDPSDGSYSFPGLPLDTYYLWSYNRNLSNATDEWWALPESVLDCGGAQPVELSSPGQVTTGKDFQVDPGATLSGTVFEDDGSTPVTGVPLLATLFKGDPCNDPQWVSDTSTDEEDGTYEFLGIAPGSYYLLLTNQSLSDYANEWWASPKSSLVCTDAQAVDITEYGEVVTGKNFQVNLGGSISGTVYQSDGTTPLTGVSVQIDAVLGSPCDTVITIGSARTNPTDGTYVIRALPLRAYYLKSNNMKSSDYVNEWWSGSLSAPLCGAAQTVSLGTEGEAITGKDFQLEPGGRISGQVLGDEGPIGNGTIYIYAGRCGQGLITGTLADETGHFTTPALPAGDVFVRAAGPNHFNYMGKYYDGGDGVTDLECGFAEPVTVFSKVITEGIDFHLKRGDQRVNLNQVVVFSGELYASFSVNPGVRDLVASATLSMPNSARGTNGHYAFNMEEDDLLLSSECTYLAYWSKRFGPVSAADYGSYDLTVLFKDGVQEVYTWQLSEATVVPVLNVTVAVNDDGSAHVTWVRNTSETYSYQVRVSDGTQEVYRSNYFSNIEELEIPASDLKCLEIGRTYRWQVRVYDKSPGIGTYNKLETVEVESPYAPLSLNNRVASARVYKSSGTLALYLDVRPGSRDYVKNACVTGPAGFSYCFDMDGDYTDLSTETRIYKGWFKQNAAWPITDGTYTFTLHYDDDLNGATDYTEVVTRALSADAYTPVEEYSMLFFVWPDGVLDFGWDLAGIPGLSYELIIRSLDGSEEYYSSGRNKDIGLVSLSPYPLRALERGRTYQWFVRSWSADGDTMEQSPSYLFYYDPAPVQDATSVTFNTSSATITNPYMPFKKGDKLVYAGVGALDGYGRYWEALDVEVVDGVQCLKLVIKGNGNNPLPDLDPDWIYGWVAQDTEGNVWLLQAYENISGETLFSGRAEAILWMPATPAAGTIFRQMADEYTLFQKSDLEVALSTGLGPYQNAARLIWTDYTNMELQYLVPNVGLVVEEYNLGLSGWQLKQIIRADSPKNQLVLSFPGYGLYQYNLPGGYQPLKTVNPSQMVTLDLNGSGTDALVAAFSDGILQTFDHGNGWQTINTVDPQKMVAADIDGDGKEELVAGFTGYGLYYYDDPGIWSAAPINTIIPDDMVRYSDGVVCDFGAAYGLWSYNTSAGWVLLNTVDPDKVVAADLDGDGKHELVVSFTGYGLYTYEPEGRIWDRINTVIPDMMLAVDMDGDLNDELVISFTGYGLYTYEPEGRIWDQINTVTPDMMIRHGNGIAVDYGVAYGLWVWSQAEGWRPRNPADPGQMTVVDINNDGVEELVVSFGGYGLYYFDETKDWQRINTVLPEDMKPIKFDP